MKDQSDTYSLVKDYYGAVLNSKEDLQTSACCDSSTFPDYLKKPLSLIDDEILNKFYGCGSPLPLSLKGKKVLDLGCGTGRDCYLASYLVGEEGEVVGVDMTLEQLSIANKHLPQMMEKFKYNKSNITFIHGYIEDLESLGLKENYFDVVISNCVLNLSPKKDLVLNGVYKLLKEGGEFYFSDVYSDRRLPEAFKEDKVLLGECLGGALYWKDFERLAVKTGFKDPRVFSNRVLEISNKQILQKVGVMTFTSTGYRLFKINGLEDACEDYGQSVKYIGGIENSEEAFYLDDHHLFAKNKIMPVCGNTFLMLNQTRFKNNFLFDGDFENHIGLFPCGPAYSQFAENGMNLSCSGPGCC